MEELTLTDPVVVPEKVTNKYHVVAVSMDMEAMAHATEKGQILIRLRDNYDAPSNYQYTGSQAITLIKTLNTANLTTKSMHKRILEKLSADGLLVGTVSGTPDP